MITPTDDMQDFINQRVQTPLAVCMVQTPTSDGSKAATQTILPAVLSYKLSRSQDAQSDTCALTFADDLGQLASTNQNGKYAVLFQPGKIDTKFVMYLGFEGCSYPGQSSRFLPYNRALVQKFTGFVETDAFANQKFTNTKTLSLIDLTKQFRFPVNDTYPHPLYGDQTSAYFDATYNLTPTNTDIHGNATTWQCDGRMFTYSTSDKIFGSTHIDPAVYIDTTGGSSPQNTPLSNSGWMITGHIGTCANYSFDYSNGLVTLTAAVPATSVVSLAGNPTYMAPEIMVRKILVELANWSPNFLSLDTSNVLLPQFLGDGQTVWDCIRKICAMTCPRFIPWQIWADENGYLRFYETRVDGPPVKTFLDGQNLISANYEFTARQLRTVVRADATVYTSNGDQPVVSLAYDVQNINDYGQTEPLVLSQDVTQNARHLTPNLAVSYLNMQTASALAQVSRPVLTCTAEIWPDPMIQPGDKIKILQPDIGMDREWIVTTTDEEGSQKIHKHTLTAQEFYDTTNFMIGTPSATAGDGLAVNAVTPPPTYSIIGAVRLGSGINARYPFSDGQSTKTPNGNQLIPFWTPSDNQTMHFDLFLNSLPADPTAQASANANQWDYYHLPPGYGWSSSTDNNGNTVYYGTAPSGDPTGLMAGETVYVGPDSIFYAFNHAAPIAPSDLPSSGGYGALWLPQGNTTSPAYGGSQTYTGGPVNVFLWAWWYLCLDSTLGVGKFYRPVQKLTAGQTGYSSILTSGFTEASSISVPTTGGKWIFNSWNGPPGAPSGGSSYYYGNNVIGISDYAATPPGFVGADILGDGTHVGVAYGAAALSGTNYAGYRKLNKGHFCVFACNSVGQRQFLKIPFWLAI